MLGIQSWDSPTNRRATIALLDGARPDVFKFLANTGDLPNACRYLSSGGLVPATTVFPSASGVAYLPFLTGSYPGTCNIPGIRWLDTVHYTGRWIRDRAHVRNYCGVQGSYFNEDVAADVASLFDAESDSVALCTPFTRGLNPKGVRTTLPRLMLGGMAHYTKNYQAVDAAVARDFVAVAGEGRRLVFAIFPAIDGLTHSYDPWHPRVLDLYRQFDRALGRYVAAGGLNGDHLLAVVSDHGASRIDHHVCVSKALEAVGLRVLRHPKLWRRDPHVAVMVSGNGAAHVYLAPGHSRSHRWSIADVEEGKVEDLPRWLVSHITDLDGVAFVAGTDGDDVILVSSAGRARLHTLESGAVAYIPVTADVLRIGCMAAVHGPREWLRRTYNGPYPDGPVQLTQIFNSARSGDLVVVAGPHADLRAEWEIPEHRSGHGSLVADHMRCLMALNKPMAGPMRTVDLFPLVLEHLGHPVPAGIDGVLEEEGRRVARHAGPA
jgi:predicted AlkP superfamily pyrophosphatase or phosphodiesterase